MDGARGPTVPGPPLLLQFCFGRVFIPQSDSAVLFTSLYFFSYRREKKLYTEAARQSLNFLFVYYYSLSVS